MDTVIIGLILMAFSLAILFFSFLPLMNKKERGVIYLFVLRLFAALIFFAAYSILIIPQNLTYQAYNTITTTTNVPLFCTTVSATCPTTNTVATFQSPTYNVTSPIPQGAQTATGWITTVYVVVCMGTVAIDWVMKMRE